MRGDRAALALVCVIAAAYLLPRLDRGWIPHDEGTLGLAAARILEGDVPHLDFDEPYTGGLSLLHAAAFALLRHDLVSLRWVLFVATVAFVAAVYRISRRLVAPGPAVLVAMTAFAWSTPNYFASLPSWYNLFFATFGTLALLRYAETRSRLSAFAAGFFGGTSMLFKVIGAYFVAGGALFLIRFARPVAPRGQGSAAATSHIPAVAGTAGIVVAVALLVMPTAGVMELVYFVVPVVALAIDVVRREWRVCAVSPRERWWRLTEVVAPFACGVLAPLLAFAIAMATWSDLGGLWTDLVTQPERRLAAVTFPLPEPSAVASLLPVAVVLLLPWVRPAVVSPVIAAAAMVATFFVVANAGRDPVAYRAIWNSAQLATPLVALVAVGGLGAAKLDEERGHIVFLLATMATFTGLVQFPYAFGIYFCYTAPMTILASLAIVSCGGNSARRIGAFALAAYLAFAVIWLNRGYVRDIGWRFTRVSEETKLGIPRASLRVEARAAETYRQVVAEVQRRSQSRSWIYAAPDCPEIYFLTDRRNPTRTFFDLFDRDWGYPDRRRSRILSTLETKDVDAIVLCWAGEFSGGIRRDLAEALFARYPHHRTIPPFTVAWREDGHGE